MPEVQIQTPPPIPGLPPLDSPDVIVPVMVFAVLASGDATDRELEPYTDLVAAYPEFADVLDGFSAYVAQDIADTFGGEPEARCDELVADGLDTMIAIVDDLPALRQLSDEDAQVLALALGSIVAWWCWMEDALFCTESEAQAWIHLWMSVAIQVHLEAIDA